VETSGEWKYMLKIKGKVFGNMICKLRKKNWEVPDEREIGVWT